MRAPWSTACFLIGAVLAAPAQERPIVMLVGGRCEHAQPEAVRLPPPLDQHQEVTAHFVFAPSGAGQQDDEESRTYLATTADLHIGSQILPLRDGRLTVFRHRGEPFGPAYGYLFRGRTEEGWLFSLLVASDSPDTVANFSLPTAPPADDWALAHDITLRAANDAWSTFGDGSIHSIVQTNTDSSATAPPAAVAPGPSLRGS